MSTTTYDPTPRGTGSIEPVHPEGSTHVHRRISWGAIFGGVILVVAVQLLLSLLGAGIGLDTVNTNAGTTPDASGLGIVPVPGGSSAASSRWRSAVTPRPGWRVSRSAGTACCTA